MIVMVARVWRDTAWTSVSVEVQEKPKGMSSKIFWEGEVERLRSIYGITENTFIVSDFYLEK